MKVLIGAQLPPGLKLLLAQAETIHVAEIGLRDANDVQLWEYAVREGAAILTKDEDFAAPRLRQPNGPTVISLRIGNCSRTA